MTKNIHILLIEDSALMKVLKQQFLSTTEEKYICQNYDTAADTIKKINQNFNAHKDFIFVVLDHNLKHASNTGADLFFQLHDTFPSQNLFIVNFSSSPEDFEQAIAEINKEIKFDAQTTPAKNPASSRKIFDAYKTVINQRLTDDTSNEANEPTLENNTQNSGILSACLARLFCCSTHHTSQGKVYIANNK